MQVTNEILHERMKGLGDKIDDLRSDNAKEHSGITTRLDKLNNSTQKNKDKLSKHDVRFEQLEKRFKDAAFWKKVFETSLRVFIFIVGILVGIIISLTLGNTNAG